MDNGLVWWGLDWIGLGGVGLVGAVCYLFFWLFMLWKCFVFSFFLAGLEEGGF